VENAVLNDTFKATAERLLRSVHQWRNRRDLRNDVTMCSPAKGKFEVASFLLESKELATLTGQENKNLGKLKIRLRKIFSGLPFVNEYLSASEFPMLCARVPFELLNQLTDFNEFLYERYATGGHPVL
jgi:hypothetical protein